MKIIYSFSDLRRYLTEDNKRGVRNLYAKYVKGSPELTDAEVEAIIKNEVLYLTGEYLKESCRKFRQDIHEVFADILMDGVKAEDLFPLLKLMFCDGECPTIYFKDGSIDRIYYLYLPQRYYYNDVVSYDDYSDIFLAEVTPDEGAMDNFKYATMIIKQEDIDRISLYLR